MNTRRQKRGSKKQHLFDKPANIRRTWWLLCSTCAALFLIDFVYHRHVVHPWEALWGFYGIFGFVGIVALILAAKEMRKIVMRKEDYYDVDG